MKTIYQKLQMIRTELQTKNLKKSGHNSFQKFDYYQLEDLLPTINMMLKDKFMSSKFDLMYDKATYTLYDYDKDESIVFEVPCVLADIKGANPIQNLGGAITYLRRYLVINAFEICESDEFDARDTSKPVVVNKAVTASENNLDYTKDIIFNTKSIDALDKLGIELAKKKWSKVDRDTIKEMFDEQREYLNGWENGN